MNAEQLKKIAVLQSIEAEALKRLADVVEEKSFGDGQLIFSEGDPPDAMYFILDGSVRIQKRAQAAGAVQKTLSVLESGDYFGEMALFDQKPRSASALASGPATLLRLSKAAFDDLHKESSAAGFNVLFAMIRTSSDRIRRLSAEVVVYDEIGKAIGESQNLEALSEVILQQLVNATFADWGLLLICSQFSDRLELCAEANLSLGDRQREEISTGAGFLGPARQIRRDLLVTDFDQEALFKSCSRIGFETPSLVIAAITVAGEFLGLIILGAAVRSHFGPNHLNLARGVARQAGQAILNARHRAEEQARTRHSRQFVRF